MTDLRDHIVSPYRAAIGMRRQDLPTPSLILDLEKATRNISYMQERINSMPTELRPHIKVHKSPDLSRMQIEAGAIGITVATAWEAVAMAQAGIDGILVANQVAGRAKLRGLAEAARSATITVAIDSKQGADDLAAAAQAAGVDIHVLVDVDVGMLRGGVRSPEDAVTVATYSSKLDGLTFDGLMGYEGHCMLEPDRDERVRKAKAAVDYLSTAVAEVESAGLEVKIVSGGGTGTYDITGADPRMTELQAGSYVVMDAFHGSLIPGFDISLTVMASVIGRHDRTIILDAGRKAIGLDLTNARLIGHEDLDARGFAEEHAMFDFGGPAPYEVGDVVELLTGYAPTTINLYDVFHVVEDGVVVDVWPVLPRGPEHKGLVDIKT